MALAPSVARAQTPPSPTSDANDHAIVYELGWAADWNRSAGIHAVGGTFAFEVTPIEHWLELEAGTTAIHARKNAELTFDVLFKKPWSISAKTEFMAGIGPELIHETGGGTHWGLSVVADFMFWPKRNTGWHLEPGYEAAFQDSTTHHGLGIAAGLLIGR